MTGRAWDADVGESDTRREVMDAVYGGGDGRESLGRRSAFARCLCLRVEELGW